MTILFHCEKCGSEVDSDNIGCAENNWCYECDLERVHEECARYRPSWDAEQAYRRVYADLDNLEDAIRQAGRGHLLKG